MPIDGQPMDHRCRSRLRRCRRAILRFRANCPKRCWKGLAWDAEAPALRDIAGAHAYAARVAGTVGAMMTLVMGAAHPRDRCTRLRSRRRDAAHQHRARRRRGCPRRPALPAAVVAARGRASIRTPGWPTPSFTPEISAIVQRLLDAADAFYCPGNPRHCQFADRLPPRHLRGARALCRDRPRVGAERAGFGFTARGGLDRSQAQGAGADAVSRHRTEWAPARKLAPIAQLR